MQVKALLIQVRFVVVLSLVFVPMPVKAPTQEPMDVWSDICIAAGGLAPIIAVFPKVTDKFVTLSQPNEPTTPRT